MKGDQPVRGDVMVLLHTRNARRPIYVNPYKVESVVSITLDFGRDAKEQPVYARKAGSWFKQLWWEIVGGGHDVTFETVPARPARMGARVNMDSGDHGDVAETVEEVMARFQAAYEIDWGATQKEDETAATQD